MDECAVVDSLSMTSFFRDDAFVGSGVRQKGLSKQGRKRLPNLETRNVTGCKVSLHPGMEGRHGRQATQAVSAKVSVSG